jgi:hypothetical protein
MRGLIPVTVVGISAWFFGLSSGKWPRLGLLAAKPSARPKASANSKAVAYRPKQPAPIARPGATSLWNGWITFNELFVRRPKKL